MKPTTKWLFVMGLPSGSLEIAKVGTPATLGPHNFVCRPPIEMRSKTKLEPSLRAFQRYVTHHLHATCTQGNQGDSQLLVVRSQTANLTPNPSFGHNICFKCPNGSCEPILDIYVSIAIQWYEELFDSLGFDLCNQSLNIRESTETPTPNIRIHLGM
jgi:hypothetical protein